VLNVDEELKPQQEVLTVKIKVYALKVQTFSWKVLGFIINNIFCKACKVLKILAEFVRFLNYFQRKSCHCQSGNNCTDSLFLTTKEINYCEILP
jgi:hypothetical protein